MKRGLEEFQSGHAWLGRISVVFAISAGACRAPTLGSTEHTPTISTVAPCAVASVAVSPSERHDPDAGDDGHSAQPAIAAADESFARLLPASDRAVEPRTRKPTAVLLLAMPSRPEAQPGIAWASGISFEPVLCTVRGKLATGARCGEVMPARASLRVTVAGSFENDEIVVARSVTASSETEGRRISPPYAPACCMYKGCFGKTIPYRPIGNTPDQVLIATRTVLGVWPKDAEINLEPGEAGIAADFAMADAPWTAPSWRQRGGPLASADRPRQAFLRMGRRYATVNAGVMDGVVFVDSGSGWREVLSRLAPEYLLATSDIDGDGRPELLVYEAWANNYGLDVIVDDEPTPAYHYSCGNI
jgi:hypothetical protein